ncbi:hypothetical protein [Roseobacter sp.]|uniref:hypothetical protein n=1 Tax=Roseobacter sp. TaxID=1907202 RepID=UPI0025E4350F|nr:hypothetical protein [Roseobacter sp.]
MPPQAASDLKRDTRDQDVQRPRRRRGRRTLWALAVLCLLATGFAASTFWLSGREMAAPQWLRSELEDRIAQAVPDAVVSFGDIVMVVDEGWRPRASVRNVTLTTPQGAEIVTFSDLRVSVAMEELLRGRVALRSVDASGVFLTLLRTEDGRIALSGVSGGAAAGAGTEPVRREAGDLAQLISQMDVVLLRPVLSTLTRASISAVTLRYVDQRANRAWTIDGGRLRLNRQDDSVQIAVDLALLGGGSGVATLAATYSGRIGEMASEFGVTISDLDAGDVASQGPAFAWLGALRAPISGALRGGVTDAGTFRPLNATLQIGAGVIQPTPESRAIPIEGARSYFTYLPQQQILRFDELSVVSQWGEGRLEGQAAIGVGETGRIGDLTGQFRLSGLSVNPADLYPAPVSVEAAELDFRLRLNPFSLDVGRLQIEDQGRILNASGRVGADSRGWDVALDGGLDELTPARLLELWPERLKPKSRRWIAENVRNGVMQNISGAVRLRPGARPQSFLSFDFAGAEARFMRTMPNLKEARGHATLAADRFVVVADEGIVEAPQGGSVDVTGTAFIIPDVTIRESPPGVVRLRASGAVTAALSLLDLPPLSVMEKAGRTPQIASGSARVAGTISMPLKKGVPVDLVRFDLQGAVTDVTSDAIVPDRLLRAPVLELVASDEAVSLSGAGDLDGLPFDVTWRQPIGDKPPAPGRVDGTAVITPAVLESFRISLPDGTLSGRTEATIGIDLMRGEPPALRLTSDLRGIALRIDPVSWSKPAGTAARLELRADLSTPPVIERLTLEAPGLEATGDLLISEGGALDRIRLSRVRIGGWFDAPVVISGRGEGVPVGITVNGGSLDLRRAGFAKSSGDAPRAPLSVRLDTLQVSDAIAVRDLSGSFTTGGSGLSGDFTGTVNGAAAVSGEMIPRGGRSAVRITAADAGAVVAAAGVLKQGRGGKLELVLTPVGTGGAFDGTLKVTDISVVDAPTMAALLNAVSIVGLVNEIGGDGIYFSQVDADFRLAPSRITLREASAVGSSIGLSMDGVFVPDTGQIAMQGVISPVYLLNSIGSVFTRKGEGLFGFNYSIRGTTAAPQVSVNPLTALTPGGIRDLFRAPKPDVPLAEGEAPRPAPAPRERPVVVEGSDR